MGDTGLSAATPGQPAESRTPAAALPPRLELPDVAAELLAIVRYLTAADGPLAQTPAGTRVHPWHERLLLKAAERLEIIDTYLRSRVAFLVSANAGGYGRFEREIDLAGAALDNCRADAAVVEDLLAGRTPTPTQYDRMGESALRIYPALESL